jgi:hypothetical protein
MGLRFHRSIELAPGMRINLGKRSMSVSVGVKGAHTTLRPGQTARTTLSLPGTGVSYTTGGQTAAKPHHTAAKAPEAARPSIASEPMTDEPLPRGRAWWGWLWLSLIILIAALLIWLPW